MVTFEQVSEEVGTNSYLKECKGKVDEKIIAGEYPPEELTEDKVIEILIKVMIEREEKERNRHCFPAYELSSKSIEFYWKILWVVLVEHLNIYTLLFFEEKTKFKKRLNADFKAAWQSDETTSIN